MLFSPPLCLKTGILLFSSELPLTTLVRVMHFSNFNIFQQLLSDDTSLSSSISGSVCAGGNTWPREQLSLLFLRILQILVALCSILHLHGLHPGVSLCVRENTPSWSAAWTWSPGLETLTQLSGQIRIYSAMKHIYFLETLCWLRPRLDAEDMTVSKTQ